MLQDKVPALTLGVFSIYDKKSQTFGPLMIYGLSGLALRDLQTQVNDPQWGNLHKYPADYALYHLGVLDNHTGVILSDKPELVVEAASLKQE